MKNRILIVLLAFMAVSQIYSFANAQGTETPWVINYQGVLTDAIGKRLTGTFQMTFSIYTDSTGGAPLWTETQSSVKCSCGIFNVELGSVIEIPVNVFKTYDRWLGVQVGSDPEMAPRRRFTSVGYAYHSGYAGIMYYMRSVMNGRTSDYLDIHIPHWAAPFQIMISQLGGASEQSAWMSGGENDGYVSYVGIDGSGNVVHGSVSLYSTTTILTVYPGLILRPKGDGSYNLVLDSSGYDLESRAVVLTPTDRP